MYVAKVFGKVIKLPDKKFKQVVRKYDITNAIEYRDGSFHIDIDCPFCGKSFSSGCNECPFQAFQEEDCYCGCSEFVQYILGGDFDLYDGQTPINNIWEAISIEKIRRFLVENFKHISKEEKNRRRF